MGFDAATFHEMPFEQLLTRPLRNGLTKPKATRGTGVRMVAMGELFANDFIGSPDMERVPVTQAELDSSSLAVGDLLFARQSLVREGAGRCCYVSAVSEPTVFESHLIRARIDESQASAKYLYYFFRSPQGREKMGSIIEQVAAAGIRSKDLARLTIPVPSLSAQHRIATILSTIDDRIVLNQQINDYLAA